MTTINGFMPRLDDAAPTLRQSDQANHRDSWLRQMELAQVNDMNQATAPAGAARQPAPTRPPLAVSAAGHAPKAQAPTDAASQASQGQGAGATAQTGMMRDRTAPGRTGLATSTASGMPAALAGAPVSGLAQPTPRGSAELDQSAVSPGTAELLQGAHSGSGRGYVVSAGSATPAQADGDAAESPAAAATDAQLQKQQQFDKRMMHLTGSGDDVNLWIRDSALTQAQSLALVQRMAADVASQGLRLKGATVNGKNALLESRAPRVDPTNASALPPIPTTKDHHGA